MNVRETKRGVRARRPRAFAATLALALGLAGIVCSCERDADATSDPPTLPERPPGQATDTQTAPSPSASAALGVLRLGASAGVAARWAGRAHAAACAAAFESPLAGLDLTPYLVGPAADAARALFDDSRHREARAAYDALAVSLEAEPRRARAARFMAAVAAYYADDWQDAATRFDALVETYPELVDTHHTMAAMARYNLGRYEAALASARRVDPVSGSGLRAALYSGRSLLKLSRPAEARDALLAWLALGERDTSVLLLLGQAHDALGESDAAADVYRELVELAPESWAADVARDRLGHVAERKAGSTPSSSAHRAGLSDLSRGEEAYRRFRTASAVTWLSKAVSKLEPGSADHCRAALMLGRAHERARDHRRAAAFYDTVAATCRATVSGPWLLYQAARSHFRSDAHDRALALLHDLRGHEAAPDSLLDDALLLEMHVHEARGDLNARRDVLETILRERSDAASLQEAAFQLFWQDYRAGELVAALLTLDEARSALPREDRSYSRGRLGYWRARTLERLDRMGEALGAYEQVVRDYPLSFYAVLALSRLGTRRGQAQADAALAELMSDGWPQPALGQALPASALTGPAFRSAVELARIGLTVSVERELDALVTHAAVDDELWFKAWFLLAMGETPEVVELARRELSGFQNHAPVGAHVERWRLAYPTPYASVVASCAERAAVPEALVLSIMREETSFDARAESPSNALGIMQLMQPTAGGLIEAGESLSSSRSALLDPANNIELGSRYLGQLSRQFADNPALVAAAYNAGGPRVQGWLSSAPGDQELDEFVEEIPYLETRRYAKRVVSSVAAYTYLSSGRPLQVSLALPGRGGTP